MVCLSGTTSPRALTRHPHPRRLGLTDPCLTLTQFPCPFPEQPQWGRRARGLGKVSCKNIKPECPTLSCGQPRQLPGHCCQTCPQGKARSVVRGGRQGLRSLSLGPCIAPTERYGGCSGHWPSQCAAEARVPHPWRRAQRSREAAHEPGLRVSAGSGASQLQRPRRAGRGGSGAWRRPHR